MVADVNIFFDFGGTDSNPGTEQDTDELGPPNIRFKQEDNATIDTNNPVPIPTTGSNFSYWKHVYLQCGSAPDTQIDNIKFYTDGGGFGTGIFLNIGSETPTKNSGSNSGYEVADTASTMSGNHTEIINVLNAFSFTSGSTKDVSISEASNIIDAIGETSDYIIFQLVVDNSASPGNLADETLTIRYDEV